MSIVSVTKTRSPKGMAEGFTVNNASGSGEYLLVAGDSTRAAISVRLSGTPDTGSFYLGYKSLVDNVIKPFQNSLFNFTSVNSVNVADLEVQLAGYEVEVYLIAAGVGASTDVDVNATRA